MFAPRPGLWPAVAIGAAALLQAQPAHAANCALPAVMVEFPDVPCIQVVDRSTDPLLHLEWGYDQMTFDLKPAEDEHRIHIFAVSTRWESPPIYLSQAQIDAVNAAFDDSECKLIDIPDESILEKNQDIAGTWFALGDPVTVLDPDVAVDLDLSEIPPGNYLIYAYTEGTWLNSWSILDGLIKVVDDPDPAASPPAIYVRELFDGDTSILPFPGQAYDVTGCVHGMEGLEVHVDWTPAGFMAETMWNEVAGCVPATDEFSFPYVLSQDVADGNVKFRGRVVDPECREAEIFNGNRLAGTETQSCIDEFIKPPHCENWEQADPEVGAENLQCGEDALCGGGGSTGGGTTTGDTDSGTTGKQEGGGNCNCTATDPGPRWAVFAMLGAVLARRRRR